MALTKHRIGEYVELVLETNSERLFGPDDVMGMTITKEIIPTKADVHDTDLSKFIIVQPGDFIFNPRTHGKKIGFGYNDTGKAFIISWNNIAFRIKQDMRAHILPDYLFLHFNRSEWDREACYQSWGSSTEVFSWEALCDMEIYLPTLSIQQKYVNIYKAMLANQQSYERGLEDLKLVCDGYIENLRRKMPLQKIGPYIEECNNRNSNLQCLNVQGVNSTSMFCDTRADTNGLDFSNYKIVKQNQFAYNPSRINLGSIALRKDSYDCIISPMYCVFAVLDEQKLFPEYLMLWLSRKEFHRSTLFYAMGSVRDTFDFELMNDVEIPIPSIEVQKAISAVFSLYIQRKGISEELSKQIKNICPILIKGSIEEAQKEV